MPCATRIGVIHLPPPAPTRVEPQQTSLFSPTSGPISMAHSLHAPTRSSGSSDAATAAHPLRAPSPGDGPGRQRRCAGLRGGAAAHYGARQGRMARKPVRIVVPFAPVAPPTSWPRHGARLSKAFGQQFIVDNRAGAGGNVDAEVVAKSPGDGYTLLMGTVGHGINRAVRQAALRPHQGLCAHHPGGRCAQRVMVMNADKAKAQGIQQRAGLHRWPRPTPAR